MYGQLVERGIKPWYRGQVQRVRRQFIVTSFKERQGYRGMVFAINDAGEAFVLTFWESEGALNNAHTFEDVGDFLVGSPIESKGQVVSVDSVDGEPQVAQLTITPVNQIARVDALRLSREIARLGSQLPGFVCWVWIQTDKSEAATVSLWESYETFDKANAVWVNRALHKIGTIAAGDSREARFDVILSELPSNVPVR